MINSKLKLVRDALLKVTDKVSHYESSNKDGDYIVWAEDREVSSIQADNKKAEQCLGGTIDFYTEVEYNAIIDDIQSSLNDNGISYILNSVQYDEETKTIHYEWIFEV